MLSSALSAGGLTSSPRSGSPQRAKMLALTSIAKRQHRSEVAARRHDGLGDVDAGGAPSREPLIRAQHRACSANDPGNDREVGVASDLEWGEVKFQKSRSSGKGPFRENHEKAPLACDVGRGCGIGKAAAEVVTLDKESPQAAQNIAGEELSGEFLLCHEGRRMRENGDDDEPVHIACVIEHDDCPVARNAGKAGDRQGHAHGKKRGAGKPVKRFPAPLAARQQHHRRPAEGEARSHHRPPPRGIKPVAECSA